MATPIAPLVIRCPACLTGHWARPDTRQMVELRCSHCKQAYQLMRWIAPQGGDRRRSHREVAGGEDQQAIGIAWR